MIRTDRQLAWWITYLKRKWREENQIFWTIQINTDHWSALWLSVGLRKSLNTHRQISRKYRFASSMLTPIYLAG